MTNPHDPNQALQKAIDALERTVEKLTRAIEGDASTGSLSVRASLKAMQDEFDSELDATKDRAERAETRVSALEKRLDAQDNFLRGVKFVVGWLGGLSLTSALGTIALIWRFIGGHP